MSANTTRLETYAWDIADILRGKFEQPEYGKIILPFTVMRRLDCALASRRAAVLTAHANLVEGADERMRGIIMRGAAGGLRFWNTHALDFVGVAQGEPDQLLTTLKEWIAAYSKEVREVLLDRFRLLPLLEKLEEKGVLWSVVNRVARMDLRPRDDEGQDFLTNIEMGRLFERLIRRFAEMSNKTAGEHYTPREVIHLMVDLLFTDQGHGLTAQGVVRDIYDPACGTGGMLTAAEERIRAFNPQAVIHLYGQENADDSYGVCVGDMLVKGHDPAAIAPGNTLTDDKHPDLRPHYMLSNPPYGMDWKNEFETVKAEASRPGGRFSAGLPRKSDGQLLFLQHMLSKRREDRLGSRIAVIMSASPLFAGGAGHGESEIRRWMLENDWVEAIVGLPTQMFYNTGIQTFLWLLNTRKRPERAHVVKLIDASGARFWRPMSKSLGDKRRELTLDGIAEVVRAFGSFETLPESETWNKVLPVSAFGYRRITVERPLRLAFDLTVEGRERLISRTVWLEAKPDVRELTERFLPHLPRMKRLSRAEFLMDLTTASVAAGERLSTLQRKTLLSVLGERDEEAEICFTGGGEPEADVALRDYENVPFGMSWEEQFQREVVPWFPDAWVNTTVRDADGEVGVIGYEIPFNRYFYSAPEIRSLDDIDAELRVLAAKVSAGMTSMLG